MLELHHVDLVRQDKTYRTTAFAHWLEPLRGILSVSAADIKGPVVVQRRLSVLTGDANRAPCANEYDAKGS